MEIPKTNTKVTLKGKSKKGKDRTNEQGIKWVVEAVTESVLFDDKKGIWLGLRSTKNKEFFRWVHLTDDENFEVILNVNIKTNNKMSAKNQENLEKFVQWYASFNLFSYKTESFPDYKPEGNYHFYLLGSPERFTEIELISIYSNDADDVLMDRWHDAIADNIQHSKKRTNL